MQAPELWRGYRATGERVVDFFRRVWSPFLPVGLTSEQLKRLDPRLWLAIRDYLARGSQVWPADLAFPNRWSHTRTALARITQGDFTGLSDREIIAALRRRERQRGGPATSERRPPAAALLLIEEGRFTELSDREIVNALRKRVRDRQRLASKNPSHSGGDAALAPGGDRPRREPCKALA